MQLKPDYNRLPEQGSISINNALRAGRKTIFRSGQIILIACIVIGVILPFVGCSLWYLIIGAVSGIVLSWLHASWATPRWRTWAYAGVADIHQLQRSAELEGLLPRNSFDRPASFLQDGVPTQLQQRFMEQVPFADDPDIGAEVNVYESALFPSPNRRVQFRLSAAGIKLDEYELYSWNQIWDEMVVFKSFGGRGSTGSHKPFFTFYCSGGYMAIPLLDYTITPGQLDLLLYIYRGRHELQSRKQHIPCDTDIRQEG